MKRLLASLLFCVCAVAAAQTPSQYALIVGSNITDLGGNKLQSGTVTFTPVLTSGSTASPQINLTGGGQGVGAPITFGVSAGVVSAIYGTAQLVDVTQANPSDFCYREDVHDDNSGNTWTVNNCVQPRYNDSTWCSVSNGQTTCDLNKLAPPGTPGALQVVGPAGLNWKGAWASGTYQLNDGVSYGGSSYINTVPGNTNTPPGTGWNLLAALGSTPAVSIGTVTTGAPGSTASVTNSGTSTAPTFNFRIPQGLPSLLGAYRGAWSSSYAGGYNLGDVVTYDGNSYASFISGNNGNEPDASPSDWGMLTNLSNLPTAFASQSQASPQAGSFTTVAVGASVQYSTAVAAATSIANQSAGGGYSTIAGLNNSSSVADNSAAMNTALASSGAYWIPNGCQLGDGPVNLAAQVVVSNVSNIFLKGTGSPINNPSQLPGCAPSTLNFTSATSASNVGMVVKNTTSSKSIVAVLDGLAINAANAPAGSVGLTLSSPSGTNQMNDASFTNLWIEAPQCINANGVGNSKFEVECQSTLNSGGTYGIVSGGSGSNSDFFDVNYTSQQAAGALPTDAGAIQIQHGTGNIVRFRDLGQTNGGFELGYWNGSSWSDFGSATFFVGNMDHVIAGPWGIIGSNSIATVIESSTGPTNYYLGPKYLVDGPSAKLTLVSPYPTVQTPPGFSSITASGSGSSYAAGTYYFFRECVNTSATFGLASTVTVSLNSGPSVAQSVTVTAGQNIVIAPASPEMRNCASVNIYRGTTSNYTAAVQIASGITSTYTSNGAETTGSAPPAGNIPLGIVTSVYGDVTATCAQDMPWVQVSSNVVAGSQFLDTDGAPFNPCSAPRHVPVLQTPSASAATVDQSYYLDPKPGTTEQGGHLDCWMNLTSGTPIYVCVNFNQPVLTGGYTIQGTDTALLTASGISSTAGTPICSDAGKGATTIGCKLPSSGTLTISSGSAVGTYSTSASVCVTQAANGNAQIDDHANGSRGSTVTGGVFTLTLGAAATGSDVFNVVCW